MHKNHVSCTSGYYDTHYIVEGQRFSTMKEIYRFALKKGFAGGERCFMHRLMAGDITWNRLIRPIDKQRHDTAMRVSRSKHEDPELATAISNLNRRKIELGTE